MVTTFPVGITQLGGAWTDAVSFSGIIIGIMFIWALVWKGLALWRAARNKHKVWFIVLLIVNTLGILEILYLFIWGKQKIESKPRRRRK